MELLRHKGYTGRLKYSADDCLLHGTVYDPSGDSGITFQGESFTDARESFMKAVECYIASCSDSVRPMPVPVSELGDIIAETEKAVRDVAFDKNLRWFIENQSEIARIYDGAFVTIYNQRVINSFKKESDAYVWINSKFPNDVVSVYPAISGREAYTVSIY